MTLLHEITHCPVVEFCLRNPLAKHPCSKIVQAQESLSLAEHQVPEPWSGHLEQAPILFLSSNPSLSSTEEYPRWAWPPEVTEDYFVNRFGGGPKPWIIQGTKSLQQDGTYSRGVAFWAAVRKRAEELLGPDIVPGIDYALTEIVHCKSRAEIGVAEAQEYCVSRYLKQVLDLAGAKIIVVLGTRAKQAMRATFPIPENTNVVGPMEIGGKSRFVVFLPHPNARAERTFAKCVSPEDRQNLRSVLR